MQKFSQKPFLFVSERTWRRIHIGIVLPLLLCCHSAFSQTHQDDHNALSSQDSEDDTEMFSGFSHQLSAELRPAWVLPMAPFYNLENPPELSVGWVGSIHLKYGFGLPKGSNGSQAYPQTHQGIGIALFDLGKPQELGMPIVAYLFQRSVIARLSEEVSLDYEWNFGISTGWEPYHYKRNPSNIMIGSRVNAYINLGLSLKWQLDSRMALSGGMDFTHFSNGNTQYPNAGMNLPGFKMGMTYDVSKEPVPQPSRLVKPVAYPKHFSYDLVFYGSWRRKGVEFMGEQVPSPHKYLVVGTYFAPMYNWGHRFRTGVSVDAIYDGSANVYTEDYIKGTEQQFYKPTLSHQLALGASGRIEYIMPFFTIGAGIGKHLLHKGGDFKGTYQSFSLKLQTTRNTFLHIGYKTKDFEEPNHLMLGFGFRFNNRTPSLIP